MKIPLIVRIFVPIRFVVGIVPIVCLAVLMAIMWAGSHIFTPQYRSNSWSTPIWKGLLANIVTIAYWIFYGHSKCDHDAMIYRWELEEFRKQRYAEEKNSKENSEKKI